MNDADLLRFGNAAKFMCSPGANFNEPPRESFVIVRAPHCLPKAVFNCGNDSADELTVWPFKQI